MALGFDIGRILEQYSGVNPQQPPPKVEQDFDDIARNSPHEELTHGLSEAFRSDQTPPFGNMVGQLFGQADIHQRTGMLNQLLGGLGPSVIGSLLGGLGGGLGGGALGGLLNRATGLQQVDLKPEDVERLSPEQVQELATRAERENPGIVDQMSRFYAQNPTLVKALGGAALAIALAKMSQRNR
jgi:predicted lipid-binding transport protein (Tim44 family)